MMRQPRGGTILMVFLAMSCSRAPPDAISLDATLPTPPPYTSATPPDGDQTDAASMPDLPVGEQTDASLPALSDDDIRGLAHAPIPCPDVNDGVKESILVGTHHGFAVRSEIRCGDVCPGQEFRVVRYTVGVQDCAAVGGVVAQRGVPAGLGILMRSTCVPTVLGTDTWNGRPAEQPEQPLCYWPQLSDADMRELSGRLERDWRIMARKTEVGFYRGRRVDIWHSSCRTPKRPKAFSSFLAIYYPQVYPVVTAENCRAAGDVPRHWPPPDCDMSEPQAGIPFHGRKPAQWVCIPRVVGGPNDTSVRSLEGRWYPEP